MDAIVAARKADEREVASLARGAQMAFTSAQETVARSLAEPSNRQIDPEQSQGILGALRRLVSAVHVLRTETQDDREHAPVPDLAPLAEGLDQTLELIAEALPASHAFTATDIPLALPQLRTRYTELAHTLEPSSRDGLLLRELDEIVDAVNSLAVMVDAETPAV
jgi:hypothetical protein